MLTGEKPALILSDFMMPHLTGAELGLAVRADPRLADIPFVIVSGTVESVVHTSFSDYDAFVQKPFGAEALLELVSHFIANGRPRRQLSEDTMLTEADQTLKRLLQSLKLAPG